MKHLLSRLYLGCGILAGLFMIAIAVLILIGIGGGLFGYVAPSVDDFAGYCMASSSFLALAYTFGAGEHIRVTLLLQRLGQGTARRLAELWCLAAGAFLAGYLAWFSIKMAYLSWVLNDVSQGLVPTPLWIPQLGMAAGSAVFFIAILERLVGVARGAAIDDTSAEMPVADGRADR